MQLQGSQDFIAWFNRARLEYADLLLFFAEFCEMLNAVGYALLRANVGHRPLHPQVGAVSLRWSPVDQSIALPASSQIVQEKAFRHKSG